jgi:hypothetical protein
MRVLVHHGLGVMVKQRSSPHDGQVTRKEKEQEREQGRDRIPDV